MRGGLDVVEEPVGGTQQDAGAAAWSCTRVDLVPSVGGDLVGHRRVLLQRAERVGHLGVIAAQLLQPGCGCQQVAAGITRPPDLDVDGRRARHW